MDETCPLCTGGRGGERYCERHRETPALLRGAPLPAPQGPAVVAELVDTVLDAWQMLGCARAAPFLLRLGTRPERLFAFIFFYFFKIFAVYEGVK